MEEGVEMSEERQRLMKQLRRAEAVDKKAKGFERAWTLHRVAVLRESLENLEESE